MIQTLRDRVAVELPKGTGKVGFIHIPDSTRSSMMQSFVRAKVVSHGKRVRCALAGCHVLTNDLFGEEVEVDGKKLRVGRERDIVAVLDGTGLLPVLDRVLLRRLDPPGQKGGIWLPKDQREMQFKGEVYSTGPDANDLTTGDVVLVPKHGHVIIHWAGQDYYWIEQPAILAKL